MIQSITLLPALYPLPDLSELLGLDAGPLNWRDPGDEADWRDYQRHLDSLPAPDPEDEAHAQWLDGVARIAEDNLAWLHEVWDGFHTDHW